MCAQLPGPVCASCGGLRSLLLGLHSSASSLTLHPSLLTLPNTAYSGGMMSVINVVVTSAAMGAADM